MAGWATIVILRSEAEPGSGSALTHITQCVADLTAVNLQIQSRACGSGISNRVNHPKAAPTSGRRKRMHARQECEASPAIA